MPQKTATQHRQPRRIWRARRLMKLWLLHSHVKDHIRRRRAARKRSLKLGSLKLGRLHFKPSRRHSIVADAQLTAKLQSTFGEFPPSTPCSDASDSDTGSDVSSFDELTSSGSDLESDSEASSVTSVSSSTSSTSSSLSGSLNDLFEDVPMPVLPQGDKDEEDDTQEEWDSLSEDSEELIFGNNNESDDSLDDFTGLQPKNGVRNFIKNELQNMYNSRYEQPRKREKRSPSFLPHVLHHFKHERPDRFREDLRVTPATFDSIVDEIATDPIFANDAHNSQMPVEQQVAITLYRFGHDGNAAGLQKVANWAGVGKGTITLVTRRVMRAVLRRSFMEQAIRMPTEEEKEEAKQWVEDHSCEAWRDGYLLVDGSLIRLVVAPNWFGESYFDRKCRHSLNLQVVSLPNLRIVDIGYGHVGSTHDATAWQGTRLAQEHESILNEGEWVWADSAYPISSWVVAPYKKPDRDKPDNEKFNTALSRVRIRSEHAIGFLKGRFQSLKGLRITITSPRRHRFATYWIVACVALHSFAMQCEARENEDNSDNEPIERHPFVQAGLEPNEPAEDEDDSIHASLPHTSNARLRAGRVLREKLKQRLFRAMEQRHAQRARRRREDLVGNQSDAEDE